MYCLVENRTRARHQQRQRWRFAKYVCSQIDRRTAYAMHCDTMGKMRAIHIINNKLSCKNKPNRIHTPSHIHKFGMFSFSFFRSFFFSFFCCRFSVFVFIAIVSVQAIRQTIDMNRNENRISSSSLLSSTVRTQPTHTHNRLLRRTEMMMNVIEGRKWNRKKILRQRRAVGGGTFAMYYQRINIKSSASSSALSFHVPVH